MKFRFASLGLTLSSVLLLAACNNGDSGSDNENDIDAGGVDNSSEVEKIDLEYWSSYSETEPQARAIKAAAESFQEENSHITINFTWNGRDNSQLLPTALQSGQEVDMYDANAVNIIRRFGEFNLNLNDFYENDYVSTDGVPYSEYTNPAMLALAEDIGEGDLYYIPMNPQSFLFMYNKDIFEEAGIENVPVTWDEFLEVAQKVKDAGYTPLTTDPNYSQGIFGYYLSRLKGEDWVYELVNDATYEMWNDPAVLEAANMMAELGTNDFYADNITTIQFPQGQQEFAINEDIAMYINGTWMPAEVQDSIAEDFSWGQFKFPSVDGGVDNENYLAYSSYGIGINEDADEAEAQAAFDFAVWINTGERDAFMVSEANALPMDPRNDYPEALIDMADIYDSTEGNYVSQTAVGTNSDNASLIRENVLKLLDGSMTGEEFVETMASQG